MKKSFTPNVLAVIALGGLISSSALAKSPQIISFDVPGAGTAPGQGTFPQHINDLGVISGDYLDSSNVVHGFVGTLNGGFTTINVPGAGAGYAGPGNNPQGTGPVEINDLGVIAGNYVDSNEGVHGFEGTLKDGFTGYDVPGAIFTATQNMNNLGQTVGFSFPSTLIGQGFVHNFNGSITTLVNSLAGTSLFSGTYALDINDESVVAGIISESDYTTLGFLYYPDGSWQTFPFPATTKNAQVRFINDLGVVGGQFQAINADSNTGIVGLPGHLTSFTAPGSGTALYNGGPTGTSVVSLNIFGAAAGNVVNNAGASTIFVRDPSGNITEYPVPGQSSQGFGCFAVTCPSPSINAQGTVVGSWVDSNDVGHGVLILPNGK